jgi:hypothetical protein
VIAICALIVALGGAAFAAIPDQSGTIHACHQKSNGNLRVVESSADCRKAEDALVWSQRGPTGPAGSNGLNTVYDEETSEVSTASRNTVELGGPSVEVQVPASGLVAITLRVEARAVNRGEPQFERTLVRLDVFMDGEPFNARYSIITDEAFEKLFDPWIVIEAPPGPHTFSLGYGAKCDGPTCTDADRAFFRNRKLWITPLG